MLQDSLLKIKEKFTHPECYEISKLIELLSKYDSGQYIYPGVLKSFLDINLTCSYNILKNIEELGLIEKVFFIQCFECKHVYRNKFKSLNEAITSYSYCENCDEIIDFNSIQLIYMVNDDA